MEGVTIGPLSGDSEDDDGKNRLAPALIGGISDSAASSEEGEDDSSEIRSDESGDAELFAIFLEQLKDNLSELHNLIREMPDLEHQSDLLRGSLEKVRQLRASANYMGYGNLIDLYDQWLVELKEYQDQLFSGEEVLTHLFIKTTVNPYIENILKRFPQLEGITVVPIDSEALSVSRGDNSGGSQALFSNVLAEDIDFDNEVQVKLESQLDDLFKDYSEESVISGKAGTDEPLGEEPDLADETIQVSEDVAEDDVAGELEEEALIDSQFATWSEQYKNCTNLELFLIFLEQLKDNLCRVQRLARQLPDSSRRAELFSELTGQVKKLRVSANYLGYEELADLYNHWRIALEESENEFSQLEASKVSHLIDTHVNTYIFRVLHHFPELERPVSESAEEEISMTTDDEVEGELEDRIAELSSRNEYHAGDKEFSTEIDSELFEEESDAEAVVVSKDTVAKLKDELNTEPMAAGQIPATNLINSSEGKSTPRESDKAVKHSLRIDSTKIDELMNQTGELVMNRAWFAQLISEMKGVETYLRDTFQLDKKDLKQVKDLTFKFQEATVALGRVASGLQDGVMKVRMLPISKLYNRYPRLVRDLVRGTDKDIELDIRGEDTELDKMIIEEISDPLLHIIRNAVDHGIESYETRKRLGKPVKGLLRLNAYHEGSHVVVEVIDDGRGIDPETIKTAALKKGLVSQDVLSHMSAEELVKLIMRPGFSTTDQITRISGRGVGMDVVKRNLEKLNGSIDIDSIPGQQTRIRIKIPLTLAVIKALMVRVHKSLFTIPLIAVDETLRVWQDDINSIKGNEVIYLRESTIPLIRLADLFSLQTPKLRDDSGIFVVVVSIGNRRIGLVVDELRGKEEVVIKPLPDYLKGNKGFSGATILGDGSISLILDVAELVQFTIGRQSKMRNQVNRNIRENA